MRNITLYFSTLYLMRSIYDLLRYWTYLLDDMTLYPLYDYDINRIPTGLAAQPEEHDPTLSDFLQQPNFTTQPRSTMDLTTTGCNGRVPSDFALVFLTERH
jgi:hypothetical protein